MHNDVLGIYFQVSDTVNPRYIKLIGGEHGSIKPKIQYMYICWLVAIQSFPHIPNFIRYIRRKFLYLHMCTTDYTRHYRTYIPNDILKIVHKATQIPTDRITCRIYQTLFGISQTMVFNETETQYIEGLLYISGTNPSK